MSTVKEKEETKIIWSKKEKDTSKETYGCEIVIENGKPSDVRTNEAPTDCFIVTYEFNGDTHQDLTRGTRVNVFDMYYVYIYIVCGAWRWRKSIVAHGRHWPCYYY